MTIRIATLQDAQSIADMAASFRDHLGRESPSDLQFLESIAKLLGSDDTEFYISLDPDGLNPTGYVLQRFRFSMWTSGMEAAIEDLFVNPGTRKQGIGRCLIEFALKRATERSCCSVCLDTNENNVASTRIYTQLGFNAFSKRWEGRQVFFRLNLACAAAQ
jgi:ribosomal protein S18 acetylase RimI-like enzyme